MVYEDEFVVYGGGRWRSLDVASGRVEGWGRARARFLVSRGGALQSVRARPVLSALRALAAGRPSAAAAGPPLPFQADGDGHNMNVCWSRSPARGSSSERGGGGCQHCQCCHRTKTSTTENKASVAVQCDRPAAAELALPALPPYNLPPRPSRPSERERDSTSPEDLSFPHKVTTMATVHSPRKRDAKRRTPSTSSDNAADRRRKSTTSTSTSKVSSKRKRRSSTSSEASGDGAAPAPARSTRALALRRAGPLHGKRSARENSPILHSSKISKEIQRPNKISRYLRSESKKMRKETSSEENVSKSITRPNRSVVISSDDSDFEPDKRRAECSRADLPSDVALGGTTRADDARRRVGPTRDVDRSTPRDRNKAKDNQKIVAKSSQTQIVPNNLDVRSPGPKHKRAIEKAKTMFNRERSSIDSSAMGRSGERREGAEGDPEVVKKARGVKQNGFHPTAYCETARELLIEESDVAILRLFLERYYPDKELLRFDTDDDFKKKHFYQINPLVNVERCPRIERMLRADSQTGRLTLVDFASKLGLRSISEASSEPKRYRTRTRNKSDVVENEPESDRDKENLEKRARIKNVLKQKVLKEFDNMDRGGDVKRSNSKKEMDMIKETLELRSEESDRRDTGLTQPALKKPAVKKVKPRRTVSTKRRGGQEYSSLEDHAIVSWVSMGGRASCVNGNRLWRELQDQYHRITGQRRTWHSLRNRYLRYILPHLAALALPPALQSRLRAAAATGELKARLKQRRNSMFTLPPRGASSRLPARHPRHSSREEEDNNAGKSSPAYSEVTRRFARTHAHAGRSGDDSAEGRSASASGGRSPARASGGRSPARASRDARNSTRKPPRDRISKKKVPRVSSERRSSSESSERETPSASGERRTERRPRSVSGERPSSPEASGTSGDSSDEADAPSGGRSPRTRTRSGRAVASSESEGRASPGPPRRTSTRRSAPSESSRRRSNRHTGSPDRARDHLKSPSETSNQARRRSNRLQSPSKSPESRSPDRERRKSSRRRLSAARQPSRTARQPSRAVRPRTRKLFNPNAVL